MIISEGCSMPAPYHGGCLCGLIRYRLTDEPLTLYACHCTDCQRRTGSAFALSMPVFKSGLDLLKGEPRTYAVTLSDGRQKHGTFCGECGTRLWGEPPKFPKSSSFSPAPLMIRPGSNQSAISGRGARNLGFPFRRTRSTSRGSLRTQWSLSTLGAIGADCLAHRREVDEMLTGSCL